jgi:LacI family transcriptional regulator
VLGDKNDVRPSLTADVPVPVVHLYGESDEPQDLSIVSDDRGAVTLVGEQTYRAARNRVWR